MSGRQPSNSSNLDSDAEYAAKRKRTLEIALKIDSINIKLREDHQMREDRLRKKIRALEAEIEAIRNGAPTNISTDPSVLDSRDAHIKGMEAEILRLREVEHTFTAEVGSLKKQLIEARANGAQAVEHPANYFYEELLKKSDEVTELQMKLNKKTADADNAQWKLKAQEIKADAIQKENESEIKDLKYDKSINEALINTQRAEIEKHSETMSRKDGEIKSERAAHKLVLQKLQEQLNAANKKITANEAAHKKTFGELHARLTEEREQNRKLERSNKAHEKAKVELKAQVKKLEDSKAAQEAHSKTVQGKLEKLSTEAEKVEKDLRADIEVKDEEIQNLKKKVETATEEWEEKMESAEGKHKLETEKNLKKIDKLEKIKRGFFQASVVWKDHVQEMMDDYDSEDEKEDQEEEEPISKKRKLQE